MKGIADTGFLVAFASENDFHHDWAVSIAGQWSEPFLTCESVLSETTFHLGGSSAVFELFKKKFAELAFDCRDHLARLEGLAKTYADRKPDFADRCLIQKVSMFPLFLSPGVAASQKATPKG